MKRSLHVHVLFRTDVAGHHEGVADVFGQAAGIVLDGAVLQHVLDDGLFLLLAQVAFVQGFHEQGADVTQTDALAVLVVDVAVIGQGEHGLAPVAFHAGNGGYGVVADKALGHIRVSSRNGQVKGLLPSAIFHLHDFVKEDIAVNDVHQAFQTAV